MKAYVPFLGAVNFPVVTSYTSSWLRSISLNLKISPRDGFLLVTVVAEKAYTGSFRRSVMIYRDMNFKE